VATRSVGVVAEILSDPDSAEYAEARVRFLVETAASTLLTEGAGFDLMEGDRVAARVEVPRPD
jgi:hypothetical protein